MRDQTIVCGYGTKGRSAASILLARGTAPERIVVIDERHEARREATAAGFAAVAGSAAETQVLEEAGIGEARSVIIAVDRDDPAVLATLTVRELAPRTDIVVAVREDENVHLLKQSGADTVISSSAAAGRLLGRAIETPEIAVVLEDLLSIGQGLDVEQHEISVEDAGPADPKGRGWGPIVAVLRTGELIHFDDRRLDRLEGGDRVIALRSHERRR